MSEQTVKPGFNFIWTIENFSNAMKGLCDWLDSPDFKTTTSDEIEWWVQLRSDEEGICQEDIDVVLYARSIIKESSEISAEVEFSLLSEEGNNFKSFNVNMVNGFHDRQCFFSRRDVNLRRSEFLPKDTLTVSCRIISINSKPVENGSLYARTVIGVQKTSIIWNMDNFSKLQPNQKASILLESISTQMDLYFTAKCDQMQLDISQRSLFIVEGLLICKVSLLDVNGRTINSTEYKHDICDEDDETWKFPLDFTRNMLLSNRERYLPRDILTLRCECSVSVGVIEDKIEHYGNCLSQIVECDDTSSLDNLHISKGSGRSHTLIEDLEQLYEDQTHSDMSLVVEDVKFPVHRNILSARSSVFRAMLDRDMMEKKTGVVEIPDLDGNTVRRMLTFLYTDTVEDLECKDYIDLYIASDKYDIQLLKEKCGLMLKSRIDPSNFVKLLMLADKHNDQSLKKHLQHFMLGREKDIFSTEDWKTLINDNGRLAAEIMQEVFLVRLQ